MQEQKLSDLDQLRIANAVSAGIHDQHRFSFKRVGILLFTVLACFFGAVAVLMAVRYFGG